MSKLSGIATQGVVAAIAREENVNNYTYVRGTKTLGAEDEIVGDVLMIDNTYHCINANYKSNGFGYSKVIGNKRVHFRNYSSCTVEEAEEDVRTLPRGIMINVVGPLRNAIRELLQVCEVTAESSKIIMVNIKSTAILPYRSMKHFCEQTGMNKDTARGYINGKKEIKMHGNKYRLFNTRDFKGDIKSTDDYTDACGLTVSKSYVPKSNKKVYKYTEYGKFVREYASTLEASEDMNCPNQSLCAAARANGKLYKGFLWSYEKKDKMMSYMEWLKENRDRADANCRLDAKKVKIVFSDGVEHIARSSTRAAAIISEKTGLMCYGGTVSNALSGRFKMPKKFNAEVSYIGE